jgi:hypothetical protein
MITSIVSPSAKNIEGCGTPRRMMSPGRSVIRSLRYAIVSSTVKVRNDVFPLGIGHS